MKTEYVRELNNNYLVLCGQQGEEIIDYQLRMVTDNEPPSFLKTFYRRKDCDVKVYYDITSLQSMEVICERGYLRKKDIMELMDAICKVCTLSEEYLLDVHRIRLSPNMIYMDPSSRKVYFCFGFPKEETMLSDLRELFRFLLDHVSHSDYAAVGMVYGIYSKCEAHANWQEILHFYQEIKREESGEAKQEAESQNPVFPDHKKEETEAVNKDWEMDEADEKIAALPSEEGWDWKEELIMELSPVLGGAFFFACIVGYFLAFYWKKPITLSLLIASGVFVLTAFTGFLWKRRQFSGLFVHNHTKTRKTEVIDQEKDQEHILTEEKEPEEMLFRTVRLTDDPNREKRYCLKSVSTDREDIVLTHFPFLIGSMQNQVDHAIKESTISRLHAQIEQDPVENTLTIRDLNSLNGTRVNELRLKPSEKYAITRGDMITLAECSYILDLEML